MENKQDLVRKFLLQAMSDRDMSQSELARLLNTEPSYINRLVNGRKAIGLSVAVKLAKVFGVSIEEITTGKAHEKEPIQTIDDAILVLSFYAKATPDKQKKVRQLLGVEARETDAALSSEPKIQKR